MARKKKYTYQPYESMNPFHDTTSNICRSMILSKPWQALTAKQQMLYVCCKSEFHGSKKTEKRSFDDKYKNSNIYFTMNRAKYTNLFKLYKNGNQKGFLRDMNALIDKGFIDCVICGADSRTKSLYKLSDRWTQYGTDDFNVPANVQTIAYRGTRKHLR